MNGQLILVVEDNPTMQKLISILCNKFGFLCHVVSTGAAALDQVANNSYDLVLMDWCLSDMTGLDCAAQIRQAEGNTGRHLPIVAMTGNVMPEDRQRCLDAGMDDYLSKPFTVDEFKSMVCYWLDCSRTSQSVASLETAFPTASNDFGQLSR